MHIGVRDLLQRLSEILKRVAQGETIRATDRGKPQAILGPVPGVARFELGIAEGWVRPADELPVARVKRQRAERTSLEVLGEDRGA